MRYLLALIFLSVFTFGYGQTDCDTVKYPKLISNSYQCKWIFFILGDTIEGIVVKHERERTGCGVLATASLTIIKTENDTIRVLDLCNQEDYLVGQKIIIIPSADPQCQVYIPSRLYVTGYPKQKMTKKEKDEQRKKTVQESSIWHANDYDERILRTTWGQIIKE